MSQTMHMPEKKKWLAGKRWFLFFIITDVIAWTIVIWQNWTRIYQFLQPYFWLFALIAEIIIPLFIVLIALFIWIFSTPYRFTQLRRLVLIVILGLIIFGVALVYHLATYQPSSPTAIDTVGNSMSALILILSAIFTLIGAAAAVLVFYKRPDSSQPIIIDYRDEGRDPAFADLMQRELEHEHYVVSTKIDQYDLLKDVLKEIRQEIKKGKLVILLLSPAHSLIKQCNGFSTFLLRFLNMYYHNFRGKGTFLLIYTEKCADNKQKTLSCFQTIDLYVREEEAKQKYLASVKAALEH